MPAPEHATIRRARALMPLRRTLRRLALLALLAGIAAVALAMRGDGQSSIRILIAAALGAGLVVLVGTALTSLALVRSSRKPAPSPENHIP